MLDKTPAMDRLEIYTFGGLDLRRGGRPVGGLESRTVEALLIYLAVSGGVHPRESLAELFWPDRDPDSSRSNLRVALFRLRKRLAPFLEINRQNVALSTDHAERVVWLDVSALEAGLCTGRQAESAGHFPDAAAQYRRALALFRDDFLAGFYLDTSPAFETWMVQERERLRTQAVAGLEQSIHLFSLNRDWEGALAQAQQLVAIDPLHEPAYRLLMRLLAQAGQRSAALARYETLCRILNSELAVQPGQQTTSLYQAIRDGRFPRPEDLIPPPQGPSTISIAILPDSTDGQLIAQEAHSLPEPDRFAGRPAEFAPQVLDSSTTRPGIRSPVPRPTGPLVGRQEELARIAARLSDPDCRLLTLTGPGGAGKTRLALEAAQQNSSRFADGVCFVALAAVETAGQMAGRIAQQLEITGAAQSGPHTALLRVLAQKELLLVLDNLEQIKDAADFIEELLQAAPRLKLLVTSRERLHLLEEWLLLVENFPVTGEAAATDGYRSEALFYLYARRVHPRFDAPPEEVKEICRLVGGSPLAIVLAAGWVRLMTCTQIAQKIRESLDFLTTTLHNVPERQRSRRGMFDASWDLIEPAEKESLAKLSLFRGGWTAEESLPVAGAGLPELRALEEKSLVQAVGEGRFDLHELTRRYAAEKLRKFFNEKDTARRFIQTYTALAANANRTLHGPQAAAWFHRLDREQDNLRAAFEHALQIDPPSAWQLAEDLYWFWFRRGYWQEGETWLRRLLYHADGSLMPLERQPVGEIRCLLALSHLNVLVAMQGRYQEAGPFLQESMERAFRLGDPALLAELLLVAAQAAPDWRQAADFFEQSLSRLRSLDRPPDLAHALFLYGDHFSKAGMLEEARTHYNESLHLYREMGNTDMIMYPLGNLGQLSLLAGDAYTAETLFAENIRLARATGNRVSLVDWLQPFARALLMQNRSDEAHPHLIEALTTASVINNRPGIPPIYALLAETCLRMDRHPEAVRCLLRSLDGYHELHFRLEQSTIPEFIRGPYLTGAFIEALHTAAGLLYALERCPQAALACGFAEQVRLQARLSLDPLTTARLAGIHRHTSEHLGETAYHEAYQKGKALSIAEGLEYLRQELESEIK